MHHDDVLVFLLSLAALLGGAKAAGLLVGRIGFPAVVGEILTGVVLGRTLFGRFFPGAYGWLFPDGAVRTLLNGYTTVAVMLLLVVAGIEVDLTVVRSSGKRAALISAFGAVVPAVLGIGLGYLLPDAAMPDPARRGLHAAFLGIALSISALPVIARTLLDLQLLKTDLGLLILTAAVANDLAGWVGFGVLSQQFDGQGDASRSLAAGVGLTLLFVVVALVVVRPLFDRALARFADDQESATPTVLSIVMILALLGASATHALGMHAVFGGFVIGIACGDSSRLREHTRVVLSDFVTSIFTPVFFATIALRHDVLAHFDLVLVLEVLAIACLAKVLGCAVGARLGAIPWRESFAIGFGMNSRGAMEILLATLALEARIINDRLFVALIVMAVVTSLISGPAMSRLLRSLPSPILELLRGSVVKLDLPGRSSQQIIESLAGELARTLGVDEAKVVRAVLAREEVAGTAIGEGVAVPHAEIDGLAGPALAFARTAREVDFDAPDGEPVRLVFLLLTRPREFDQELQILSALAHLLVREDVRRGLLEATRPEEVFACLERASRQQRGSMAPPSSGLTPTPFPASSGRPRS